MQAGNRSISGITFTGLATVAMAVSLGAAHAGFDQRQPVILDDQSRNFVLQEMRQYVVSIQQIVTAVARGNMGAVAAAARPMGQQAMQDAPATLMPTLPASFRMLGMSSHKAFDGIADAAATGADGNKILTQLGAAMTKCVACHAGYRIESAASQ